MPITLLDATGNPISVGSSSVGGVEHQTAHMRWGAAGAATTVEDTSPLPAGLRAQDATAIWRALSALAAGGKFALGVQVLDNTGTAIVNFGGAGTVTPYTNVLTGAGTGAVRLKSGAGKLRSVHAVPASDEDGPIYIVAHDSNSSPPASGDTLLGKWGIAAGRPDGFTVPGGGIAFAAGLGIRVVKNAAVTDNTNVQAGTLIMVTYE